MRVDSQNFQPLALFNQFVESNVKTDSDSKQHSRHHINKDKAATHVVNERLNEAVGASTQNNNQNSDVFDFEAITKNIFEFVTGAINNAKDNGATDEELKVMLSDAQKGIKEGLSEASKELAELGLLSHDIKHSIKDTEKELKNELNVFVDELFTTVESTAVTASSYREATHYNLTEDASFNFTTKEGDQVNITFNSEYLQQSSAVLNSSEDNINYSSLMQTSYQGAFSFEVNGDLNADEQQAINELMGNLQNVSDLFFNGDLESAFEEAQGISMNPTHLAAFSMDLQRTETFASVKEYQQVLPGKEIAQQFNPVNDELTKVYEQAKPFALEEHLIDLLQWLAPEEKQSSGDFLDYSQSVFDQLSKIASQMNSFSD